MSVLKFFKAFDYSEVHDDEHIVQIDQFNLGDELVNEQDIVNLTRLDATRLRDFLNEVLGDSE
jgi:hypothetical protein